MYIVFSTYMLLTVISEGLFPSASILQTFFFVVAEGEAFN